jgi:hypothetical protein
MLCGQPLPCRTRRFLTPLTHRSSEGPLRESPLRIPTSPSLRPFHAPIGPLTPAPPFPVPPAPLSKDSPLSNDIPRLQSRGDTGDTGRAEARL